MRRMHLCVACMCMCMCGVHVPLPHLQVEALRRLTGEARAAGVAAGNALLAKADDDAAIPPPHRLTRSLGSELALKIGSEMHI